MVNGQEVAPPFARRQLTRHHPSGEVEQLLDGRKHMDEPSDLLARDDGDAAAIWTEGGMRHRGLILLGAFARSVISWPLSADHKATRALWGETVAISQSSGTERD